MTIDARIPMMGLHINIADEMAKGEALRAARFNRHRLEQADQRDTERRASLSDYLLSQGQGSQAGGAPPSPLPQGGFGGGGRLSDLMGQPQRDPGTYNPNGGQPSQPGTLGQLATQGQPPMPQPGNGEHADPRRMAYERAVRADPDAFLTFEGKRLDISAKQLEAYRDLNDTGMQLLGGVNSQQSYDAALNRAQQLYRAHGMNLEDLGLPAQYSPEVVEQLRMQGMSTDKQLQAVARENKLDWDMWDDAADNQRADDNADNIDADRDANRALNRERVDIARRRANAGRGGGGGSNKPKSENALFTDIQERFNKGEEVTDRERVFARDYVKRHTPQPRQGRGSSTRDGAIIRNPTTGERLRLEGGKWVPVR